MNYILLLVMTMLGAVAGYCLKKASGNDNVLNLLKSPFLYSGGILYLLSAVINIYLLKIMPYSVVLPLTSITYVWTMVISYFALHETISKRKMIGVILILIGTIGIVI